MGRKKNRLAINVAAFMIHKFYKIWKNRQVARALLIDVKEAFNHILLSKLAQRIANLNIDYDFIC